MSLYSYPTTSHSWPRESEFVVAPRLSGEGVLSLLRSGWTAQCAPPPQTQLRRATALSRESQGQRRLPEGQGARGALTRRGG